jgi:hypothetical protein
MTQIVVDRFGKVSFHNGLVRIECLSIGPDGKPQASGTVLLAGAEAGKTMNNLVKSLQDLHKQVQARNTVGRA